MGLQGDGLSEKPVLSPDASPEEMGDPGKAAYVRPPSHVGFEYVGDGDVKTAANFTEETDTGTGFRHTVNRFLWRGGSGWDAWLNSACAQIGQVLLTIPSSYSQMGLVSAILWQVFCATAGSWTSYLLNCLYLDYRKRMNEAGYRRSRHVLQYHEVMSFYLGKWGGYITLTINILALGSLGVVQIIACASDIHILAPGLNKRDWALIFGGVSMLTILIPTLHNYRVWSFVGLVATTYTTWFLVGAAAHHGVVHNVQRPSHTSLQNWFLGSSNILFAFGSHSLSIEVMEGMWRPQHFGWIYPLAVAYTQTLTMPNAITLHQVYGTQLLKNNNALAVVPASAARDVSIILMIMHQAVAYGLFVTPLYYVFEKAIGTHHKPLWIRLPSRIPVCLLIWFIALLIPFFGPLNSVMGAFFTTWASYIIPGIAYIWAFRKPPSFLARSWNIAFAISVFIGIIIFVFGFGFGAWAAVLALVQNGDTFGVFAACYQCTTPKAAPAPHAG